MVDEEGDSGIKPRKVASRILKAAIKGFLFYAVYYACSLFLAPLARVIPGLQQTLETFAVVYISLLVVSEVAAGTIYQHFLNVANALFVISYLVLSLRSGIISMTFQNVTLQADLHFFLVIATILSFIGLSRAMLQAISFASQKAENTV
jgi:hypothetical protein